MVLPDWVKRFKTKGVEIRDFGNRYYAYRVSSHWDSERRRAVKVTGEYLGVVTRGGIVKKQSLTEIRGDYDYGNVAFLYQVASEKIVPILREAFPYLYERMVAYSLLRLIHPLPIKSVRYLYLKTYLSRIMDESMTPSSISGMLSSLPMDSTFDVMRRMTERGEYALMDSTAIFSRSSNISILDLGHNSKDIHLPQINVMMLFSVSREEPTFMRVIPGSIRDVTALVATMEMAGVERCVVILDKGFYSLDNIKRLKSRHLSFIMPLRRNSSLIPDAEEFMGVFSYEGRPIKYWLSVGGVFTYEDPVLRMEEERDYLHRVEQGKSSKKSYAEDSKSFGRIHLLSDLKDSPESIYVLYKKREYVEYAFNVFKNDLEADRSYLRDERMLFTYLFLNFLSLNIHFRILAMKDEKYSVQDILLILSRIKVYSVGEEEIMGEIPKDARELVSEMKIDLDILRKY
jgi:transposase